MDFEKKIDFCIIHVANVAGSKPLVFFCHHGVSEMTEAIWHSKEYVSLKSFAENLGFVEIDYGVFESRTTEGNFNTLPQTFLNAGLNYNKSLEDNIRKSFNVIMSDVAKNQVQPYLMPVIANNQPAAVMTKDLVVYDGGVRIPKKGQKITLYFYMFLKPLWISQDDFIFEFTGDMGNKRSDRLKNYMGIYRSEFIRTDFGDVPYLQFESIKNHADFLADTDFLYRGLFTFDPKFIGQPQSTYSYNIMEIKKHMDLSAKLVIQIGRNEFQNHVMLASDRIKEENKTFSKELLSVKKIKDATVVLKKKLVDKMNGQSDEENYEKAAVLKKDIQFIEDKIKLIETLKKDKIARGRYLKMFGIKE